MKHVILTILLITTGCSDYTEGLMDAEIAPYVAELESLAGLKFPKNYNYYFIETFENPKVNAVCKIERLLTDKGYRNIESIIIKRSAWDKLGSKPNGDLLKLHLLAHEIFHCFYRAQHSEHISIMSPYTLYSTSYTQESFIKDLTKAIYYLEGK